MKADASHIMYGNKASLLTLLKWKFLILWFAYSDNRKYLQDFKSFTVFKIAAAAR